MENSVPNGQRPLAHLCLVLPETIEVISSFLSFKDLKSARLLNQNWYRASAEVWKRKSQIRLPDQLTIRKFLVVASNVRKVLPYSVENWVFQGETMQALMNHEGHAERVLLEPFWSSVRTLTFSDWNKRRHRYERYYPNPNNPYGEYRRVPYYTVTRKGSAYHVTEMFKLCTNLTKLFVHYPLLGTIKGAYIGPKQFPKLEKLVLFQIYTEGTKWSANASENAAQLLQSNMELANAAINLPRGEVNGGTTLVLRILDHSPNLTHVTVTTGTTLSSRIETWFMPILLIDTVKLPKLTNFNCSIPLNSEICRGLQAKPWKLCSLHLRILPGVNLPAQVQSDEISNMLISFSSTLEHLELIILANQGEANGCFTNSSSKLYRLKSLEVWGYNGSFDFLRNFRALRNVVIGITSLDGSYDQIKDYFEQHPLPTVVKLEVKADGELHTRLDQGPLSPFQIPI